MKDRILTGVAAYYTEKINQHGNTSLGVDWNSKDSQYLRFEQVCRVIQPNTEFSLLDFGCGCGELVNYLNNHTDLKNYRYCGYDVSEKMIENARVFFKEKKSIKFSNELPKDKFDYVIASGVFNVKLDLATNDEWLEYITTTLMTLSALSNNGFSFNALTSYSDKDRVKDYLYYADPLFLFDYCKKYFSKNISLIHDYDLYEFTIIVRK